MTMRPRRDIDDLDDSLFDRDEAQRRREERAERVAAGQERLRQEEIRDAAAAARARESMRESNRRGLLSEYLAAGVAPPHLDGEGQPTISLALLRRMGWTITEMQGERVLVAPPQPTPWEGHRDADSLPRER